MKISARLREQAALCFEYGASCDGTPSAGGLIRDQFTPSVRKLVGKAYWSTSADTCYSDWRETYAEAAQRLREGWEP